MKKTGKFYSIRVKMIGVYIGVLLFTCISIFAFFVIYFNGVYRQQADSHMEDVIQLSRTNVSNMMEQIDQLSVSVLVDQTVQNNLEIINKHGKAENDETGESSISSNEAAISSQIRGSVFNINGVISLRIYSLNDDEIFIGTTNREYLEYSISSKKIYAANGAACWGMAGDDHYIYLCRAILSLDTMKPIGYMVIICQNDYLGNALKTVSNAYSGKVYLLDENDEVITAGDMNVIGKKFPYRIKNLRQQKNTVINDMSSGEISYYYVSKELPNGWSLISTISNEQFREGVRTSIFRLTLIMILAITISIAATSIAVRHLTGPTKALLQTISKFGKGGLDARVQFYGKDEIGQIGVAYNQMADNIQNLMEQVYSLEIANKEAEIEFLKMQINPHFLYNSLDTISWLGYMDGNEKVSDLAVLLAKLLRASIQRDNIITVREELETVQNYLQIQSYRFGDKITVEYQIDEQVKDYYMPSFLLQPLIENSVIHGLENQIRNGTLWISVSECGDWLYFKIKDNGKGMTTEQVNQLMKQCIETKTGTSIGLKNVYRRLQLLYKDSSQFTIISEVDHGTSISFMIPVLREKEIKDNGARTEL